MVLGGSITDDFPYRVLYSSHRTCYVPPLIYHLPQGDFPFDIFFSLH